MGIVYIAINTINNKAYIGKTTRTLNTRITEHTRQAKTAKRTVVFHSAIRKHGIEAFEWSILAEVDNNELNTAEKHYIELFRRNGTELYNQTNGGDGLSGYKQTEEHKQKIRLGNLGKTRSEETKAKIGQAAKGRIVSDETRIKLSLAGKGNKNNLGFKHTPEQIQKQIEVQAKTYIFRNPSGDIVEITNLKQYSREHGLNAGLMCQVALGKRNHHKGWTIPNRV